MDPHDQPMTVVVPDWYKTWYPEDDEEYLDDERQYEDMQDDDEEDEYLDFCGPEYDEY